MRAGQLTPFAAAAPLWLHERPSATVTLAKGSGSAEVSSGESAKAQRPRKAAARLEEEGILLEEWQNHSTRSVPSATEISVF